MAPTPTPDPVARGHGADEDFALLYQELRRLAHDHLARANRSVLQTTALVHEAYLRLNRPGVAPWTSKRHFMGVAAKAMRSVLVDRSRRRQSHKRGGGATPTPFDEVEEFLIDSGQGSPTGVLEIHEALEQLASEHPDLAKLAEQRFFGGLTVAETAAINEVPESAVKLASAYVRRYLGRD